MDFAEAGTVCDSEASQSSSLSLSCGGGQPELRLPKKEEEASSQGPARFGGAISPNQGLLLQEVSGFAAFPSLILLRV